MSMKHKQRLFLLKKFNTTDILIEVKGATVNKDGTIWDDAHTIPVLQPNNCYSRQQLDELVEQKTFDKIPEDCYVRINQKTYNDKEFILEQDYLERLKSQA